MQINPICLGNHNYHGEQGAITFVCLNPNPELTIACQLCSYHPLNRESICHGTHGEYVLLANNIGTTNAIDISMVPMNERMLMEREEGVNKPPIP